MTTFNPSESWSVLKTEILRRIDDIENATPWQQKEPMWWTNMKIVRKVIQSQIDTDDKATSIPSALHSVLECTCGDSPSLTQRTLHGVTRFWFQCKCGNKGPERLEKLNAYSMWNYQIRRQIRH